MQLNIQTQLRNNIKTQGRVNRTLTRPLTLFGFGDGSVPKVKNMYYVGWSQYTYDTQIIPRHSIPTYFISDF